MTDLARWLVDGVQTGLLVWLVLKRLRPAMPPPGSLARIHQDLEGMREELQRDSGEIRKAAAMLEKRVEILEDEVGMHRRAVAEISITLKDMSAEMANIHAEVRVLNANSGNTLKAIETMLAVRQSLERIEQRLPGPA